MAAAPKIKLQSSDSVDIIVGMTSFPHQPYPFLTIHSEREIAERSVLIKNMLEDVGDQAMNDAIPIPNVSIAHCMIRAVANHAHRSMRLFSTR